MTLVGAYARSLASAGVSGDRSARRAAFACELRAAFERLGPAFVKLGQLVSVRPDVFAPELVFEMERLCDRVTPVPAAAIRGAIEAEFGRPVGEVFASFDDEPVASASIAQVHRAVLATPCRPTVGDELPAGTCVAVKVVRPGIETTVREDVEVARRLAARFSRLPRICRYALPRLLDEFAAVLSSECDLRNEAVVADRYAFDFRDDPLVVIPRVAWTLTTRRVMTTEFVDGWRLSELDEPVRAGIDARGLALHGAKVFLRQVLELGRYHADLHPANLFVTRDGRICYLDFGIVGTTQPEQRLAIAHVLAATAYGDADRALRYSARLGLVVPEHAQARVRTRVGELMARTLARAPRDVRGFAVGFLRILDDEHVHVPEGYGLLIKALVTIEGVARALYPDIDITEEAKPYATALIARSMLRPPVLAERLPEAIRAGMRVLVD